mmetsp:Transcript_109431/g.274106  ORF Transcript_109431/g.274106 Transcript_109431/m.274106 type:complete len:1127 (-) Transcript_109431:14-3394(-)
MAEEERLPLATGEDDEPEDAKEDVPGRGLEEHLSAEEGGFDLICPPVSAGSKPWVFFSEAVCDILARKPYCVAKLPMTDEDIETAVDETYEPIPWEMPKKEFCGAYLGGEAHDKITMLKDDRSLLEEPDMVLGKYDRLITHFAMGAEMFTEDYLGFTTWGRLNGMVRVPPANRSEEIGLKARGISQQDYEDGRVIGHLNFLERRRLMVMCLIENSGGELCIYPKGCEEDQGACIPVTTNKMVIFRNDLNFYTYRPVGFSVVLQSWLMRDPPAPDVEEEGVVQLPLQLHSARAHVLSLTSRYPGDSFGPSCYWSALVGGTDSLVKVPVVRWDVYEYYSEERNVEGTTYAMHGGFCSDDAVTMFDNEFFNIPVAEAEHMSPGQRIVLETGFEVLHRAGHSKETVRGLSCGVFLGDSGNDWPYICESQGALRVMAQSNHVTGTRLSHSLGLQGPCNTTDTACSSSLVAVGLAHSSLRETNVEQKRAVIRTGCSNAIALGSSVILSPRMYILYCGPGMLSPRGRCFTYDSAADGYARGEGCGGFMMNWSDSDDDVNGMLACLIGSAVNQDGRSASMTAPNGPAQQMCIRASMAESGLIANEITVAECHGTGTALGDPIEVSALRAVMDDRKRPILNTSAKTNIGHLEAAAGMAGLIKCIAILVSSASPANVHLNFLNPHMDVNGYPVFFENELSDYEANTGVSGVSSFGFGGTNARSDLWSRCLRGPRCTTEVSTSKWLERRSIYYQRIFHFGAPGPHETDRVSILGTWDAYATMVEMDQTAPGTGVYTVMVVLGETRREQFRMVLNRDQGQSIHPRDNSCDRNASVLGPDADGKGKTWLIDGRDDDTPAWTIYQIKFEWGFSWETGEYKKISWEATDQVAPARTRLMLHRHTYSLTGTRTAWKFQEMARSKDEEGLWTTSMRIGLTGYEEFQITRDNDWTQTLYPAMERCRNQNIPIRGPDGNGKGKNWLITGPSGDIVRIQLQVLDGEITLIASSDQTGVKTWQSTEEELWMKYYVSGSWNKWGFTAMKRDPEERQIFRCIVRLGRTGQEEFKIVCEKDWSMQLYPEYEQAGLGDSECLGPDDQGHGLNWLMTGRPGCAYQITLDLYERDMCRVVWWNEILAVQTREE